MHVPVHAHIPTNANMLAPAFIDREKNKRMEFKFHVHQQTCRQGNGVQMAI